MRKRWLGIAFLLCAIMASGPSRALEVENQTQVNRQELQTYFASFANLLDCTRNNSAKFSNTNIGELEFMPASQNGLDWTQLFTATIQLLPDNDNLAKSAINGFASNVLNNYARHTKLLDSESFQTPDGTPIIYMEYLARTDLLPVYGAGVYGRHTNTMAAFTRYEVRGRPLTDNEKAVIRNIAQTLRQAPTH